MTDVGQPSIPQDSFYVEYSKAVDELDDLTSRFAAAADRVRHWDASVPTCPRWTVRKLVIHLGSIHAWALSCLGAEGEPEVPRFVDHGEALPLWYRDRAAALVGGLRETPPDALAWTLWGHHVASFWARRQLHETAVHGVDLVTTLATAGSPEPWPIPADLALDGLREVVDGFYPRQVRLGRTPGLPGTVRFDVQADDGASIATLDAPAARYTESGSGETYLGTVSGRAEQLYLAVWGRGPFPDTPPDLAATIRDARLTP